MQAYVWRPTPITVEVVDVGLEPVRIEVAVQADSGALTATFAVTDGGAQTLILRLAPSVARRLLAELHAQMTLPLPPA